MNIQVNSDSTVSVDASLKGFVKNEAERILKTVAPKVTRVEIHLSDVNGRKTGPADMRCVVEARPAGGRPLSTTATAKELEAAIGQALRKMLRALRSFFGRHGRAWTGRAVPKAPVKKAAAASASSRASTPVAAKVTRAKEKSKTSTTAKRARRSG
jgi:ribosome-associated translation inhibitor RaiA